MTKPLRFLDRVDEWLARGPAVATAVRELCLGDRPVTKASDASRIPEADVCAHVLEVAWDVARGRVREPLAGALFEHFAAVKEEFEIVEGAQPLEGAGSFVLDQWRSRLRSEIVASLRNSDVPAEQVEQVEALDDDCSADALADAVLAAPVADPAAALGRMGLSAGIVDALVAEIRTPPVEAQMAEIAREVRKPDTSEEWSLEGLADWCAVWTNRDLIREGVTYVLTDPDMIATGAELLGLAGDAAFASWCEERLMFSTPGQDRADVEEVLRLATGGGGVECSSTETSEIASDVASKTACSDAAGADAGDAPAAQYEYENKCCEKAVLVPIRGTWVCKVNHSKSMSSVARTAPPKSSEASDLTRAVGAALAALFDHGCETDKAMAAALGVDASVVRGSRKGAAPWAASKDQFDALYAVLRKHFDALDDALDKLKQVYP